MPETNAITRTAPREIAANGGTSPQEGHTQRWSYRPPTDIVETAEAYTLTADVPGARPESINLSVEEGIVSIQAHVPWRYPQGVRFEHQEYGVGDYHRRFRLGDDVDEEGISASYAGGVLTVALPKRASAQARRIEISPS